MREQDTHEPRVWRLRWTLLAVFAVLYGVCLPRTVQNLDSGELVASAWKLTIAHPPGYPLFVWLHHAFAKVCPWGSVYHRAAVGNALCVLGALALLLRIVRSWLGVALVAVAASVPVVWRYAVLPDVFGLHLLFVMVLVSLAFEPPTNRRVWIAALAFGFGAANHQSIVFLLPLLLLTAWEAPSRPRAFMALLAGALATVVLYASLLALDSQALDAWSTLVTVQDVVDHFLRKSYGTFRLSGYDSEADVFKILADFATACGAFGAVAVVMLLAGCALHARNFKNTRAWWLVLACLVAYVVTFFPRMNSGGHVLHDGVRERFFLFPIVMLAALAVRVVLPAGRAARLGPFVAAALALLAMAQVATGDAYGYAYDTVVEDYARNLLSTAKAAGKPAFVIVETDTQVFSMHYVAAVEDGYQDVVPVSLGNIFLVDRLNKIKQRWPDFAYDVNEIFEGDKRQVFRSFIGPNLESFAVFSTVPVTNPHWRTTFYPLGRRIENGTGIAIGDAPVQIRPPVHKAYSGYYVETKELYADYAVYYLARGKALLAMGNAEAAKQAFFDGAQLVPYCIPCLKNFCTLDGNRDQRCGDTLERLQANEYHYLE